jgi:hypothetical protein
MRGGGGGEEETGKCESAEEGRSPTSFCENQLNRKGKKNTREQVDTRYESEASVLTDEELVGGTRPAFCDEAEAETEARLVGTPDESSRARGGSRIAVLDLKRVSCML